MNWKWPQQPGSDYYAPWYLIGWRILVSPLVILGITLCWVGFYLSYGQQSANDFLHDNFPGVK